MFNFSFNWVHFIFELFFNLTTGTFEEVFFRGLILIGLSQYLKPFQSIILTSAIFSLWHYDVVSHPIEYLNIFIWSLYAGYCFLNGASLLSLALFHFFWDQIIFGFYWDNVLDISPYLTSLLIIIFILISYLVLFKKILVNDIVSRSF